MPFSGKSTLLKYWVALIITLIEGALITYTVPPTTIAFP
ncbi:hypothetical protein PARMER_02030 [Parabacteroides merdae ATCC 43184]|nr:hypothetical protein PARMER_02030 [Parabacteroides merdae ATCC 43184]